MAVALGTTPDGGGPGLETGEGPRNEAGGAGGKREAWPKCGGLMGPAEEGGI